MQTTSESTPITRLAPTRMATPPPSTTLDLRDAESAVGWIDGRAIGFRGFGHEEEAASAAWAAFRTMSRRFAHAGGFRPIPVDTEPLSFSRSGDVEHILAGGRPIATLVRPGDDSRSGPDWFGFELQVPVPADEDTMRATARLLFRTLRRSGIRWAMWMDPSPAPESPAPAASSTPDAPDAGAAEPRDGADGNREAPAGGIARLLSQRIRAVSRAAALRTDATGRFGAALVIIALAVAVLLPALDGSALVTLLGGLAMIIGVVALASLVQLVVRDVLDSWRARA